MRFSFVMEGILHSTRVWCVLKHYQQIVNLYFVWPGAILKWEVQTGSDYDSPLSHFFSVLSFSKGSRTPTPSKMDIAQASIASCFPFLCHFPFLWHFPL